MDQRVILYCETLMDLFKIEWRKKVWLKTRKDRKGETNWKKVS